MTPQRKAAVARPLEPAAAVVRKVEPCNDNRPDVVPPATLVRTAQPSPATRKTPTDSPRPAIVTVTSRKRRIGDDPPLPMELPLFHKPLERDGDDYKRMKTEMTRRIRGETN